MSSTTPDGALSIEEWAVLDDEEVGLAELVDGRLEEEEVTTTTHDAVVDWVLAMLRAWVRPRDGRVFGSTHKMGIAPRRGRIPDVVAYFAGTPVPPRNARMTRQPPDLAVEVVSERPRDARRDRVEKKRDYAAFGVRSYWIIDPELRTLEVLALGDARRYVDALSATTGVHDVPGCDGLRIDLDALWADIDALPADEDEA